MLAVDALAMGAANGMPRPSISGQRRRSTGGRRQSLEAELPPILPPPNMTLRGRDKSRALQISRTLAHEASAQGMVEVVLCDVGIDDVLSSSVLAPFLRTATLLTHLDLRSNAITHVGMEALGAALKANTSLQELHLSKNPLGDKGAMLLGPALCVRADGYSSVTHLSLSHCDIGEEGGSSLAQALANNITIRVLHLCGNRLGDAATSALCTSLLCDPQSQCTTLSLSNNRLTSTGASALSRALSDNTTLTALHLDGNIGFGDSGATALAESLIRNGALATLSLAACRIGDLGAAALGSALSANFGLFSLVLRQNNVRDLGADAVWRGLEGNRCLRHLDMACNGYGPVGVKLLSTVLARNAFVTSLRVDGCKIGTDGACSIAQGLENNQSLRELGLSQCDVGAGGAEALAHALNTNGYLLQCHLGGNPCAADGVYRALSRKHLVAPEDFIDAMDTRVLAAKEERSTLLRSLEAKEVLIERYKNSMGLRDFDKEERETKATFAEELKRMGTGEEVEIPVAYGRIGNVVTSVKCTVTTDLAEVRHRLETVLLPSELNYAFYSITGGRISREEEASRTVVWDCGPKLLLRPESWIDIKE